MRLTIPSIVATSVLAITLAIAAPQAVARLELNPSSPGSHQAADTGQLVRPNPDQQPSQGGGSRARPTRGAQLTALNRTRAQDTRASASNPAARGGSGHATRLASGAAPSIGIASGGFDWGDGAIGAGTAAAIALLLFTGILAVRQRSRLRHS
jgi:hypothetical protein